MPGIRKRTISLPTQFDDYIEARVAAGEYASASEVIRAGLRALQEREGAIERWLKEDLVPKLAREAEKGAPEAETAVDASFQRARDGHKRST